MAQLVLSRVGSYLSLELDIMLFSFLQVCSRSVCIKRVVKFFLASARTNPEAWFRPQRKRQQLLAFIVSDKGCAKDIADGIMNHMHRGVTALKGTGMFTGEDRAVLMCAITVTEVNNLKSITAKIQPGAFVITTNASEVFGRGFVPLNNQ